MSNHDILFVFGPARGGTTYVGGLLDRYCGYGMGPEGTFVADAVRKAQHLQPLDRAENQRRLAEYLSNVQMLRIIRDRYPDDSKFSVSPDDILERMQGDTVADAIHAVFKAVADFQGKPRVGNKNPGYWKYLPLLLDLFPKGRFLFVNRDGRDVALSRRNVSWGGGSAYETARDWARMVRAVNEFRTLVPNDQFLALRYEELLQDPMFEIHRIASFAGIDDPAAIASEFAEHGLNTLRKDNSFKWSRQMLSDDVRVFEAVAGSELSEQGYERRYPAARLSGAEIARFQSARYWRLLKLNIYQLGNKLPQDKAKWQNSWVRQLFRPGSNRE